MQRFFQGLYLPRSFWSLFSLASIPVKWGSALRAEPTPLPKSAASWAQLHWTCNWLSKLVMGFYRHLKVLRDLRMDWVVRVLIWAWDHPVSSFSWKDFSVHLEAHQALYCENLSAFSPFGLSRLSSRAVGECGFFCHLLWLYMWLWKLPDSFTAETKLPTELFLILLVGHSNLDWKMESNFPLKRKSVFVEEYTMWSIYLWYLVTKSTYISYLLKT